MKEYDEKEGPIVVPEVHLRPLGPFSPGAYLTALYGAIVVLFLLAVLVLPRWMYDGTKMTIQSSPQRASVYLDGRRVGATPVTLFVKRGDHLLTLKKPFFHEKRLPIVAKGYGWGPFPRKTLITAPLALRDLEGFLFARHKEISSWALAASRQSGHYAIPPLLTETMLDVYRSEEDLTEKERAMVRSFLKSLLPTIDHPSLFADMLGAWVVHTARGGVLAPFARQGEQEDKVLAEGISPSLWLSHTAPTEAEKREQRAPLLAAYRATFSREPLPSREGTPPVKVKIIEGIAFYALEGGSFIMGEGDGESLPRRISLPPFLLSESEITQSQFAAFLQTHPEWSPSRREDLIREGKVSETYLETWQGDRPPMGQEEWPVHSVSWFAASAYARWIGRRVRGIVRLPSEAEWEYAARQDNPLLVDRLGKVSSYPRGVRGFRGLLGSLWEWSSDGYAPLSSYFLETEREWPRMERSLRGWSWLPSSTGEPKDLTARASLAPSLCSPTVGFRLLLESSL